MTEASRTAAIGAQKAGERRNWKSASWAPPRDASRRAFQGSKRVTMRYSLKKEGTPSSSSERPKKGKALALIASKARLRTRPMSISALGGPVAMAASPGVAGGVFRFGGRLSRVEFCVGVGGWALGVVAALGPLH